MCPPCLRLGRPVVKITQNGQNRPKLTGLSHYSAGFVPNFQKTEGMDDNNDFRIQFQRNGIDKTSNYRTDPFSSNYRTDPFSDGGVHGWWVMVKPRNLSAQSAKSVVISCPLASVSSLLVYGGVHGWWVMVDGQTQEIHPRNPRNP